MENEINIAEILKDCPKDMELYSPVFGQCRFKRVYSRDKKYCIEIISGTSILYLNKIGQYLYSTSGECLLSPSKENRDWSKFVPPCQFKDGDVLATDLGSVFLLNKSFNTDEYYGCYVGIGLNDSFHICKPLGYKECCGLATEEEKQKLFQAIKDNGYKWNADTKILEKLIKPKFKVGDIIQDEAKYKMKIIEVHEDDECYIYESSIAHGIGSISFNDQDGFELAPNKFDINTLKPFESKVLVRDNNLQKWSPAMWGYYDFDSQDYPYKIVGGAARYCIPYEKNEYLLGTTNDCDGYYKNWN